MQQLAGQDAMFLLTELDGFPINIGGVSIYDQSTCPNGVVRFKDILELFASRLDRSPIFRRKLVEVPFSLDQPYWIDDDQFDLEFHVRHIALPKPGDFRQLCIQVARLHALPLDRNRPLWEAYIIEGLDNVEGVPKGSFALYLKIHHCVADGVSGVQFFGAFNDPTPLPPPAKPLKPWRPEKRPSRASLLGKAYLHNLRKPMELARLARDFLPARKRVQLAMAEGLFHKIDEVPDTRFNGELSRHRVLGAVKFDFAVIRAIKNAVPGATINDAVLAIISGAMRKYLDSKDELPSKPLVSLCPINIRDDDSSNDNMVAAMHVSLCSDITDPLQRLGKIHEESESSKAYTRTMGNRFFMALAESVPVGIQSLLIHLGSELKFAEKHAMQNTAVTNVQASSEQLYMCGAQIVDSFGVGPLQAGLGLFHTVNSMVMNKKGVITLSFLSCRDVMPDPDFYRQCLLDSFAELRMAALPEAAGPSKRPKRKVAPKPKPKPKPKKASKSRKPASVTGESGSAKVEPAR